MYRAIAGNEMIVALLITASTTVSIVVGVTFKDISEDTTQTSSRFASVSKILQHVLPKPKSWKYQNGHVALYSFRGRRSYMEDEFIIEEDIHNTGVSLFAIFDGHGGDFSAKFAVEELTKLLKNDIMYLKRGFYNSRLTKYKQENNEINFEEFLRDEILSVEDALLEKLRDMKKEMITKALTALKEEKLKKLTSKSGVIDYGKLVKKKILTSKEGERFLEPREGNESVDTIMESLFQDKIIALYSSKYIKEETGDFDYKNLLTDGIVTEKEKLKIESIRGDESGTTAFVALLDDRTLYVANVGDSRGVLGKENKGFTELSTDHKPEYRKEQQRIINAGGSVTQEQGDACRVDGRYSLSRSLGDLNEKPLKRIIAMPDTYTFDLNPLNSKFLLLASDGLWDMFESEEAVEYVKENFDKELFGAKAIALESYKRGTYDNITVMIIKL